MKPLTTKPRKKRLRDTPGQLTIERAIGEADDNVLRDFRRCGRPLRGRSARRGIGPVCEKKSQSKTLQVRGEDATTTT